jgi:hypothetical protein
MASVRRRRRQLADAHQSGGDTPVRADRLPLESTGIAFANASAGVKAMIMFLVVLLVVLWLIGMVTTTTLGGALHILLVIAIVFLLIRAIRGVPI